MNSFLSKQKSFSDVFPYVAIADDCIICAKPNKLTAILELNISTYDDIESMQFNHDRFMRSLLDLPSNSTISIYYCKMFNKPEPVILGKSNIEIVNFVEQNSADFILDKLSPEFSCFLSITIPIDADDSNDFSFIRKLTNKKNSTNLSNNIPQYKSTKDKLEFIIKGLIASTETGISRLTSQDILRFLSIILNHEKIDQANDFPGILKSDWNSTVCGIFDTNPGYVYYGGSYHTVLSLRANSKSSKLPSKSHAGLNLIFTHRDLWPIPFIIQHTIHFPSRSEGLARARRRENMIANRQGGAKWIKFLEKTPEGIPIDKLREIVQNAIDHIENSFDRFLEQHFHVVLWESSLDKLDKQYKSFEAAVSGTYKLKREKFNIKGSYFSLLPGNEHVENIRVTLPSYNISDFMPIDLPRYPAYSNKSKMEIYYHNEIDSFAKIDPFDPRCDNHNTVVVGGSGSGKSFTVQNLLWQVMKYNPCISIIDFGGEGQGSYLSFVKNLGGTYLEVNFTSDFSINPFDGAYFVRTEKDEKGREYYVPDIDGTPNPLKYTSLMATLEKMIVGDQDIHIPAPVRVELRDRIVAYYKETNNNELNECNLSEFAERHLKDNQVFISNNWDLYKELMEFIGTGHYTGLYSNFFKATKKIPNDDIICFDMAGLNGHPKLKQVLIPTLINMITQNILSAKSKLDRKKFLIQDEAWRDLCQGGDMQAFLVEMYRTVRKLNGQITLITQALDDLLNSKVADALTVNTSYYWLIGNNHKEESLSKISCSSSVGRMELSFYDIKRIRSQQSKRDFYLLTPYYSGQLRFYPTKEFCALATTNPNDKKILRKHMKDLGVDYVTPEVIKRAINEL